MDVDSSFRCECLEGGRTPVVAFAGELDVAASEQAWVAISDLIDGQTESLVIDLSAVTFIDSRGLSVLIRAWTALGPDRQRAVTLRGPTERIRRTLDVAGVGQAFEIV